ncbi:putative GABA-specific permease [Coccomyxa subellipsoidea C-169]|uniref:GABA-specific permease n=1 Tax=Coccomyxa subellipsoidea (strain C-169) TaxID=574566 RepID=I0Z347_COCSC|nr:putative GABA-specific permease [Coccomyxa subellipsoidea C-169]EIE25066.1 putative GABA-specific permease [Coccomyxa subellipsoidea C-169]|eukprot:XP_005649610.1 putative GABA-specific permease [Coccomyxa subellipsoidea C-169]
MSVGSAELDVLEGERAVKDVELDGHPLDSGQRRLEELGYKQELRREFGILSSTCAGFASTSFLLTITGLMPIAYVNGGPVAAVWGWVMVSVFTMLMALSMAEIASAYPLAGGPYFWCVELTKNDPRYTLVAWVTGWLNVLGQVAATAGAASTAASHLGSMWMLSNGHVFTQFELFLTYALIMLVAGVLSSTTTNGIRGFTLFSGAVLAFGGLFLIVFLPAAAPAHQSATFVFTYFRDTDQIDLGLPSTAYLFLMGMLLSEFGFIGYEAPAQFAEETKSADRIVPWGIVNTTALNGTFGLAYIVAILFCIQEPDELLQGNAGGNVVAQVFWDIFEKRFGYGQGALIIMALPLVAMLNATVMSMAANTRMLWSFSRDGGVPLYRVWAAVNKYTGTPLNATWAMSALAFLIGLPMLLSNTAFIATGALSSVGLYVSYAIPIVLRVVFRENFTPGPFRLGALQPAVNVLAVFWTGNFVCIDQACFLLPTSYPVTDANLNWTPVTVGIVMAAVLVAWYLPKYGAATWYRGKSHTLPDKVIVSLSLSCTSASKN